MRNLVVSIWTLQLVCSAPVAAGVLSFVEELSVALKLAAAAVVFVAVLAGSFEGAVEKTVVEGFGADFVPEVAAVEVAVEVAAEAAAEVAAEVAAAAAAAAVVAVVAVVAAVAAAVGAVGLAVGLAVDLVKPVLRALLPSVMEVAKGLAVAAVFVRPEDLVDLDYSIGKRRAAWPYAGFVAVAVVQHAAGLELEQLGVVVVVASAAAELAAVVYEVEGPDIGPHYWLLEWQLFAGDLRH